MAESVQRIIIRRAIPGQHYQSAAELMDALSSASRWWTMSPTPFVLGASVKSDANVPERDGIYWVVRELILPGHS